MTLLSDLAATPDTLLKNIIMLTEQRDQLSLEVSLFQALGDILEPVVLLSLEWSGDSPECQVVHESSKRPLPPEAILSAAHALSFDMLHMAGEDGIDYLLMSITAMAENARRVLIMGNRAWREPDVRIARGMLQVYRNFVRLLNDSEKDTLTGLLNRKRLDKHLAELLASRRKGRRGDDQLHNDYLAVLDIDHFKTVNDNFGHLIGDEVLLIFANLLRHALRDGDRCYRYGGEEFVVLLCDMRGEQAMAVLERLRAQVANQAFPQVGHITVSIGYSLIENQQLPSVIIEEADRALYYAKSHGRDQVREFQTLWRAGEVDLPDVTGSVELF